MITPLEAELTNTGNSVNDSLQTNTIGTSTDGQTLNSILLLYIYIYICNSHADLYIYVHIYIYLFVFIGDVVVAPEENSRKRRSSRVVTCNSPSLTPVSTSTDVKRRPKTPVKLRGEALKFLTEFSIRTPQNWNNAIHGTCVGVFNSFTAKVEKKITKIESDNKKMKSDNKKMKSDLSEQKVLNKKMKNDLNIQINNLERRVNEMSKQLKGKSL